MSELEKTPASFEEAIQELEQIVQAMQSGNLPLEAAIDYYERGMKLQKYCENQLEEVKKRMDKLQEEQTQVEE